LRVAVHCSPGRLTVYKDNPTQQQYLTFGISEEREYALRLFIKEKAAMEWLLA
jgi:hypothetical protein